MLGGLINLSGELWGLGDLGREIVWDMINDRTCRDRN